MKGYGGARWADVREKGRVPCWPVSKHFRCRLSALAKFLTVALAVCLLAFSQQVPTLHVHSGVHARTHLEDDHPVGAGAHVHVASSHLHEDADEGPELERCDPEHSAVDIAWFRSEKAKTPTLAAPVPIAGFEVNPLRALLLAPFGTETDYVPPGDYCLIPRGPPA